MAKKEPGNWLSVAVEVALDWRLLLAVAILVRVLLNK
jgi:hypothetical protein